MAKRLLRLLCLFSLLGVAGLLAACSHERPEDLVGTWGETLGGQTYALFRIERWQGRYVLYTNANGQWKRTSDYVNIATRADLEQLVHHRIHCDVTGLKSGIDIMFEVPAGWSEGNFSTRTGYFAVTQFGPVELVRL